MQSRIRGSESRVVRSTGSGSAVGVATRSSGVNRKGGLVLLALSLLMSQAAPVLCQGDVTESAKSGSSFKIDDQPVGSGGSAASTTGGVSSGGAGVSSGSGASSGGASSGDKPASSGSGGTAGSGGSTGSSTTEAKGASTSPNTDDKNAAETLWLINNQVEKKLEKEIEQGADIKQEVDPTSKLLDQLKKNAGAGATISKPGEAASTAPAGAHKGGVEKTQAADTALKAGGNKLFGRIEQISAEGDVQMPTFKALTPKLDMRDQRLMKAGAEESKYSGTVAKAYPEDFRGTWGGQISVWSYKNSPEYLKEDAAEANQTARLLPPKRSGNVNFTFYQTQKGIALEPAKVLISVPLKDTRTYGQMMGGGAGGMGSGMGAFGGAFEQMMGSMEAPAIVLYFGNAATNSAETGVSGNQFRQQLYKNVIRALGPGIMEQQILTRRVTKVAGTGKTNTGYEESVTRFKRLPDGRLYVLAASVNYNAAGKYLSKLIMYGTVAKGNIVQTDPNAAMGGMMGGMMNMGGMQSLFGGSGGMPGGGRMPPGMQIPGLGGGAGGFGGIPGLGGAGGGGDLNQQMKQMTDLLKQMQGGQ